jgi:hypothetical protein
VDNNQQTSKTLKRIEELTNDFSIPKYNSLKINYLVKIITDSDKYSKNCTICQHNLQTISQMVEQIPQLDNIEYRQPYEKEFNLIRKHFHSAHGYIAPLYYTSRWTVALIVAGLLIAAIVSYILVNKIFIDIMLLGFITGLASGYTIGTIKEKKYRKAKKII